MVPKGWTKHYLAQLIQSGIKNGYSPNPAAQETGYWVLGLGALGDGGILSNEIKPVEPTEKVLQNILEHDDFLISRSNTPDKVGRSVRFKGEIQNCSYPDLMMRFRIHREKADPDFIEHQLKSEHIRTYYKTCAAGSSVTMVKINKGTVEKTPICLPPLKEQIKISQILSIWDQAITTTEQLLSNIQRQKKALTQQLLTGKLRLPYFCAFDERKKTKYGEIPADWQFTTIGSIAVQTSTKNTEAKNLPVLSCSKYEGFVDSLKYFKKKVYSDDTSTYKIIKKGSFGFPSNHIEEGSIGYQNLYDAGIVSPIYIIFKTDHTQVNDLFLYALLKTDHYRQIFSAATNASVDRRGSLRWEEFSKIKVQLPSLDEQKAIVRTLSTADREIEAHHKKLTCLKQEKKALMQQLLTGKRRVKVDDTEIA